MAHPAPCGRFQAAPTPPRNVVVVEDDEALRAALVFSFGLEGFSVRAYPSGEAFLADPLDQASAYVIDQRLPGVDGISLIERLRADGALARAILITTNPDLRLRARAALAGLEIVEKPLLGDSLLRALQRNGEVDD